MLLSIYNLGDDSGHPVCSFGPGEHVVGRGPPLQCTDKRISRKHVQLEVSENAATITAKHQINPCFYRAAEGKHMSILKYEFPYRLSTGDKFGFFPDKYWFQIKLTASSVNEDNVSTANKENEQDNRTPAGLTEIDTSHHGNENDASTSGYNDNTLNVEHVAERLNENENNASTSGGDDNRLNAEPAKNGNNARLNIEDDVIVKVEEIVDAVNLEGEDRTNDPVLVEPYLETSQNDDAGNISGDLGRSIHSVDTDIVDEADGDNIHNDDTLPENPDDASEQVADPDYDNVTVKQEVMDEEGDSLGTAIASTDTDNTVAGCSTGKVYRDRCWYGASCYRKNDSHRLNFSHPNDNDYDTDPGDPRPSCPFGGNCYRKNKDHRKDFKHSRSVHPVAPPPPPASPQKRKAPTKRKKNQGDSGDGLSQSNIVNSKRRRNNKKLTESPLDDYDLADPFLDDSGDEYQMDSDESDSDEDSQRT